MLKAKHGEHVWGVVYDCPVSFWTTIPTRMHPGHFHKSDECEKVRKVQNSVGKKIGAEVLEPPAGKAVLWHPQLSEGGGGTRLAWHRT